MRLFISLVFLRLPIWNCRELYRPQTLIMCKMLFGEKGICFDDILVLARFFGGDDYEFGEPQALTAPVPPPRTHRTHSHSPHTL